VKPLAEAGVDISIKNQVEIRCRALRHRQRMLMCNIFDAHLQDGDTAVMLAAKDRRTDLVQLLVNADGRQTVSTLRAVATGLV
jgi:alpha-D-ribose 1-methylphosphonate 5-triphosphate synthase subunit PhnG